MLLLVLAVACGGDDDGGTAGLLQLRPVLDSTSPPCEEGSAEGGELVAAEQKDGEVVACLRLAEPIVDATDVRSATLDEGPAGRPAVNAVLGRTGSADLDRFAERSQGKRLAIVVNGELVNAPTIQFPSFAGRIQVAGLPEAQTTDLFEQLQELTRP